MNQARHRLKAFREGKDLSQDDLALQLGCSQTMVSFVERGLRLPTLSMARKAEAMTADWAEGAIRMSDWPSELEKPVEVEPADSNVTTIRTTTDVANVEPAA